MSDIISVTGVVATEPKHFVSSGGRPITAFRLACAQRHFDRATSSWAESGTNWYSVTAFNSLATNAAGSLRRGDRVVLRGRLRIRDWEREGRTGTSADIVADSIGHDLLWGTSSFTRTAASGTVPAERGEGAAVAEATAVADGHPAPAEPAEAQRGLVEAPF